MRLPASNRLPVNLLAACFNATSATYKYYWLSSTVGVTPQASIPTEASTHP